MFMQARMPEQMAQFLTAGFEMPVAIPIKVVGRRDARALPESVLPWSVRAGKSLDEELPGLGRCDLRRFGGSLLG